MLNVPRASLCLAGTVALLAVIACSAPAINGFTLTASPGSVTLVAGSTAYINVASTGESKAAVTASVVLYGLPAGVTLSPAAPTVTTGSQTTLALTAAPSASAATSQVQVSGYSGLAYSGSYVNVTVVPAP